MSDTWNEAQDGAGYATGEGGGNQYGEDGGYQYSETHGSGYTTGDDTGDDTGGYQYSETDGSGYTTGDDTGDDTGGYQYSETDGSGYTTGDDTGYGGGYDTGGYQYSETHGSGYTTGDDSGYGGEYDTGAYDGDEGDPAAMAEFAAVGYDTTNWSSRRLRAACVWHDGGTTCVWRGPCRDGDNRQYECKQDFEQHRLDPGEYVSAEHREHHYAFSTGSFEVC